MNKKILLVLSLVLIVAFAAGIQAKGTLVDTMITNATTSGTAPDFVSSTNPGQLSGQFTNVDGAVFNADLSLATIATTRVLVGYDLSVWYTSVTEVTQTSGAGSTVIFSQSITNWGNASTPFLTMVSNVGASGTWRSANVMSLYTNGFLAIGPTNFLAFSNTSFLAVDEGIDLEVHVLIPAAQADGDTNHIWWGVVNAAGYVGPGDTWPGANAFGASTSDVANNRDFQSIDLFVVVSGPVLRLSKTVDLNAARPYEDLVYTIKYTNTGSAAALEPVIRDVLPSDTVIVAGSLQINHNNGGYVVLTDAIDGDDAETNSVAGNKIVEFAPNGGIIPAGVGGRLQFTVRIK